MFRKSKNTCTYEKNVYLSMFYLCILLAKVRLKCLNVSKKYRNILFLTYNLLQK